MAQENNIAQQLNDLLVSQNFHPEMLDTMGKPTQADEAKVFNFDYISPSGKNYGTMVIILDSDNDMKVFYGDNLGRSMEGDDKESFFNFIQHLHKFANMHRWTYSPKDLNQIKYSMQGLAAIQEGLFEGYYGTRKVSYAGQPTEARLMIKHNQTLGENDARFRHVESLFIETADNERFKLPFKSLSGGRAMLEHVKQGGKPYDVRGVHIAEMVQEINTLSRFNRASRGRVLEGITQELVTEAQQYYTTIKENLKRLSHSRGYSAYFEAWHPAEATLQEELVDNIKTMFIEQTLDARIEAALPLLARIQQQGNAMKEAEIFESWVNQLAEGTWALPDNPEAQEKLNQLMSKELIVGPDATNATEQLYDVVGDDQLFDILSDLASRDPRANIWDDTDVQARLQELGVQLNTTAAADQQQPVAPAAGQQAPGTAPEQAVAEGAELESMLKHAGVAVKESVLTDSTGHTLDHILQRFSREVADFKDGDELDDDLYDALYDYYFDDMPYGTKKARTGDPYEWVSQRLADDLGVNEGVLGTLGGAVLGGAVAGPLGALTGAAAGQDLTKGGSNVIEGSCNMTMEGEYCPEHGLAECGGMYETGTVAGSVAPVMGEGNDDPINYNAAITGSYYESKESDAVLARIKSLALIK
jgi:hypothetical protein